MARYIETQRNQEERYLELALRLQEQEAEERRSDTELALTLQEQEVEERNLEQEVEERDLELALRLHEVEVEERRAWVIRRSNQEGNQEERDLELALRLQEQEVEERRVEEQEVEEEEVEESDFELALRLQEQDVDERRAWVMAQARYLCPVMSDIVDQSALAKYFNLGIHTSDPLLTVVKWIAYISEVQFMFYISIYFHPLPSDWCSCVSDPTPPRLSHCLHYSSQ